MRVVSGEQTRGADHSLLTAFALSLACHAVFLGIQAVRLEWTVRATQRKTLELIYESQVAEHEMAQLKRQLAQFAGRQAAAPGLSEPSAVPAPMPQIRIPDRVVASPSSLTMGSTAARREAVVDLTNLAEASQGNPVLLSYFGAIREQIQRTANRRPWLAEDAAQGLICVSFVLSSSGSVQSVAVLTDRSLPSRALREIALQIVRSSSPFPPFPPSMAESSKMLIVPLEFLPGS